jgi:hypothetical protein
VIAPAGVEIVRASVLLLDREYVHPGGAADLERLFTSVDLTEEVRALVPRCAAA